MGEVKMAAGVFYRVAEQLAFAALRVGNGTGQHACAFQQLARQARLHIALGYGHKLHGHAFDETIIEVQVDGVMAGVDGVDFVKARQRAAAKHHVVVKLIVVVTAAGFGLGLGGARAQSAAQDRRRHQQHCPQPTAMGGAVADPARGEVSHGHVHFLRASEAASQW